MKSKTILVTFLIAFMSVTATAQKTILKAGDELTSGSGYWLSEDGRFSFRIGSNHVIVEEFIKNGNSITKKVIYVDERKVNNIKIENNNNGRHNIVNLYYNGKYVFGYTTASTNIVTFGGDRFLGKQKPDSERHNGYGSLLYNWDSWRKK